MWRKKFVIFFCLKALLKIKRVLVSQNINRATFYRQHEMFHFDSFSGMFSRRNKERASQRTCLHSATHSSFLPWTQSLSTANLSSLFLCCSSCCTCSSVPRVTSSILLIRGKQGSLWNTKYVYLGQELDSTFQCVLYQWVSEFFFEEKFHLIYEIQLHLSFCHFL